MGFRLTRPETLELRAVNPLLAPIAIPARPAQLTARELESPSEVVRSIPHTISLLESLEKRGAIEAEPGEAE